MQKYFQITNKSFQEYGVKNHRDLWNKVKSEGYTALRTDLDASFTKGAEDGEFHAILSTANLDRHGDIVVQDWVIGKNIPILDSHDYGSIRNILGVWKKLSAKTGKLEGDMDFWINNELGALAKDGVESGYVNFVSAGFIPLEFSEDGKILKSELLEGSLVSVPANKFAEIKYVDVIKTRTLELKPEEQEEVEVEEKPEEVIEAVIEKKGKTKTEVLGDFAKIIKNLNDEEKRNQIRKYKRQLHQIIRSL
jgi:hypothetical protein